MKFRMVSAELTITSSGKGPPKVRGRVELSRRSPASSIATAAQTMGAFLAAALRPTTDDAIDREARAIGAPPALPQSRRDVRDQRDRAQRGMQRRLRESLALDTIEAFYDDTSNGKIRRLEGTGDPHSMRCAACGIRPAVPMDAVDAEFVRAAFRRARMPQAMAYAFATTRIILTQKNAHRLCQCDRMAWNHAIADFQRDPRGAWRRLGVVT